MRIIVLVTVTKIQRRWDTMSAIRPGYEIAPDGTAYDVLRKADAPVGVLIHGLGLCRICGVTILPILPLIIRW